MTSKLQKNYIKSVEHAVKLNNEIWQDIKTFFCDNYCKQSIIITLDDENTQKFIDFDRAEEFIIEEDSNIRKIRLFAQAGEEVIKIDYVNGMWTKQAAVSSEANHTKEKYNKVSEFNIKLRDNSKTEKLGTNRYISFVVIIYVILDNVCDYFNIDILSIAPQIFVIGLLTLAFIMAYGEIAWGKKKIHFLFDERKLEQYKVRKKRNRIIEITFAITLIVSVTLTMLFL